MKHILAFLFSLSTLIAFSQKHMRYIPWFKVADTNKEITYDTIPIVFTDSVSLTCKSQFILHTDSRSFDVSVENKGCSLYDTYFQSGDTGEIRKSGWEQNKKRLLERANAVFTLTKISDTTFKCAVSYISKPKEKPFTSTSTYVVFKKNNVYALIPSFEFIQRPKRKDKSKTYVVPNVKNTNMCMPGLFNPTEVPRLHVFILEETGNEITLISFPGK